MKAQPQQPLHKKITNQNCKCDCNALRNKQTDKEIVDIHTCNIDI